MQERFEQRLKNALGSYQHYTSKILLHIFTLFISKAALKTFPAFFMALRCLVLRYSHNVIVAFTAPNCHGLFFSSFTWWLRLDSEVHLLLSFLARYSI